MEVDKTGPIGIRIEAADNSNTLRTSCNIGTYNGHGNLYSTDFIGFFAIGN